jgi:Peptidase family M28
LPKKLTWNFAVEPPTLGSYNPSYNLKMKRLFFVLVLISQLGLAQKVDKFIKEEDVTRIIRTLAADDMKGRSSMDEASIGKAAAFIASEFKEIGLKPLTGSTSYFQELSTYEKLELKKLSVKVDGVEVPQTNTILYSDKLSVKMGANSPWQQIEKDKDFRTAVRPYFSDTTSRVVFVAPEHKEDFSKFYDHFSKAHMIEKEKARKGATVFILGNPTSNFSVEAVQTLSPFKMKNVVGMLEGKTKKNEMVIFSGHYDHIGIQEAVGGDSIANGADDDASGTTAVIELARYFKNINDNNRTLIFVAFTAEETGGYGARYFSKQLDPEKVMAMFNIEMIGKPSKWGQNSAFITGYERSDFGEILQKNLAGTPFQFKPDPYTELDLFYRSDNATLARLGVPAHTICTDQIDIDKFYHTVNDEVETLDMKNITSTIKAIALSSKSIVDGTDTPKRIDKSTVR